MLIRAIEGYLANRRAAGFALRYEGSLLKNFAAFSEMRTQHYVSTNIAVEWAGLASSLPQRARRLGMVTRLARYLRAGRGLAMRGASLRFASRGLQTLKPTTKSSGRRTCLRKRGW